MELSAFLLSRNVVYNVTCQAEILAADEVISLYQYLQLIQANFIKQYR